MLAPNQSNYICAVAMDETGAGICFCDLSTGEAQATSFTGADAVEHICNELGRFAPGRRCSPGGGAGKAYHKSAHRPAELLLAGRRRDPLSAPGGGGADPEAVSPGRRLDRRGLPGGGRRAQLSLRDTAHRPELPLLSAPLRERPLHGAGSHRPAQSGTDRDPPGRREEGQSPVGAG